MGQPKPEDEIRAFIAIELPADIKGLLAQHIQHLRAALPGPMRWVAPESVHLTLKFLGNIPAGQVPGIVDALERACRGSGPLRLRMGNLGCFPNPGVARVVWLGIEGDTEALCELQTRIESEAEPLGFAREGRRFVAHLTLARAKETRIKRREAGRRLEELIAGWRSGGQTFDVGSISLMRSTLTPQGAVYDRLARVVLGSNRN